VVIEVDRVAVHRHQSEPGVVEIANGPPGPMLDDLPDGEVVEVGAVLHGEILPRGS
jgi:hypothetical protein